MGGSTQESLSQLIFAFVKQPAQLIVGMRVVGIANKDFSVTTNRLEFARLLGEPPRPQPPDHGGFIGVAR